MGLLTILGLGFDVIGATLILGPEYQPLERKIRWLDPVYTAVNHCLKKIEKQGEETEVKGLQFYPMRWFINRYCDEEITGNDTVVFAGDTMYWDAEKMEYWTTDQPDGTARISFPSPSEEESEYDSQSLKTYQLRQKYNSIGRDWMYKLGLLLLISGFLLQLIEQLICCPTAVGNQPK